jgi:hypothetical protein
MQSSRLMKGLSPFDRGNSLKEASGPQTSKLKLSKRLLNIFLLKTQQLIVHYFMDQWTVRARMTLWALRRSTLPRLTPAMIWLRVSSRLITLAYYWIKWGRRSRLFNTSTLEMGYLHSLMVEGPT